MKDRELIEWSWTKKKENKIKEYKNNECHSKFNLKWQVKDCLWMQMLLD